MAKASKKKKSVDNIPQEKAKEKKPLTSKERVRKHINNKNDVITEEDISNIDVNEAIEEQPLELPDTSERPKDEDKDNKNVTPWDVIDDR